MEQTKVTQIVESLIFASETPVSAKQLKSLLTEVEGEQVSAALETLAERYAAHAQGVGIELVQVAGGYRFRTRADLSPWIRRLFQQAPLRLGKAMLEVLAIVAYRQPITRAEIDDVRGVDSAGSVRSLLERDLIRIVGRKEIPGSPQLYGTSRKFLEVFGLKALGDLPSLEDDVNELQQQLPLGAGAAFEVVSDQAEDEMLADAALSESSAAAPDAAQVHVDVDANAAPAEVEDASVDANDEPRE